MATLKEFFDSNNSLTTEEKVAILSKIFKRIGEMQTNGMDTIVYNNYYFNNIEYNPELPVGQ